MSTLIERCRAFRESVLAERESLRTERTSLLARLTDAEAARDRLQAWMDTPDWGAMDSGESIAAGMVVRYGLLRYRAKSAHSKALTRSPINLIYWEVVTDEL